MRIGKKKIILVASGHISGTYADSFHMIHVDTNTVGSLGFERIPVDEEILVILNDIERHKIILKKELHDLNIAKKILRKLQKKESASAEDAAGLVVATNDDQE